MNRLLFLLLALLMAACFSEGKVDLASPTTFTKYFSDGYNNDAIALEETSDNGFIILLNSSIQDSEAETARNRISLIKTDEFGNEIWKKYYPSDVATGSTALRWKGYSLTIIENDGYLIMGESINSQTSSMLALKVDKDGENPLSVVYTTSVSSVPPDPFYTSFSTAGQASTIKINNNSSDPTNGNYLFLASSDLPTGKMVVGELDKTSLNIVWKISRGDDFSSTLTNRLFYNVGGDELIYWGGTVIKTAGGTSDIRFTKNPINTIPGGDPNIGDPLFSEAAFDMCLSGNVFCFIGSIDVTAAQNNTDILFYRGTVTDKDTVTYTNDFIDPSIANFTNDKNEVGNSISTTKDGGFIILATIDTYTGIIGRGDKDILLMKVDGFGNYQWSKSYGSLNADNGKVVRQTSDGGYVALGTTSLAATKTIMLLKTDKNGDVD